MQTASAGLSIGRRDGLGGDWVRDITQCGTGGEGGCLRMSHCEFHYSYLLPQKPGILPFDETITKSCRRCGAIFTTKSRIRKRCDACQEVVAYEKQQKANARLKARRAAKRAMLRG